MSDLVDKLKKKQAEQAAKRPVGSPQADKEGSRPSKTGNTPAAVDNQADDDAIEAVKKSKPGGQAGGAAAAIRAATAGSTPEATQPPVTEPDEYTVVSGDNLSAIAQKLYGDANRWRDIYNANKETIGDNPSAIRVGMVLKIPR